MKRTTSPADFLERGDIAGLIEHHRARWGSLRMEAGEGEKGGDADGGQGGSAPAQSERKESPAAEDGKGFPANTPLAEMTSEQREAYWKDKARKHEQRANERADYEQMKSELERLRQRTETENEKAIREAREAGAAQARQESQRQTIASMARMALRSRGVKGDDIESFIAETNLTAFLSEDGQVNDERLLARVDRYAGMAGGSGGGPDMGQGRRGGNTAHSGLAAGAALYEKQSAKTTTLTS